jgi:ribosome-associated toxin RatA of RatAB toxin-antitoxin module
LEANWSFVSLEGDSCLVDLEISFEFRSYIYAYVANLFFVESAKGIMPAFEKRCDYLFDDETKLLVNGGLVANL